MMEGPRMRATAYVLRALHGIDNRLADCLGVALCSACRIPARFEYRDVHFPIPKKMLDFDIIYTRDLYEIVSSKFIHLLEDKASSEFAYYWVNEDRYALVVPKETLKFDARARGTQFLVPCRICGKYFEIIGATPAFLEEKQIKNFGIYKTDLKFGTGIDKAPLTIIGSDLKSAILKAKLRGVDFEDVLEGPAAVG